jgi:hypothetical protein
MIDGYLLMIAMSIDRSIPDSIKHFYYALRGLVMTTLQRQVIILVMFLMTITR